MLLVGDDAVHFNRQFAAQALDLVCPRFSPLMEENMLLATGAEASRRLYSAAGFFESLPSAYGLDFGRRYAHRFGVDSPMLNSLGESCYEGVKLLAELVRAAGSTELPDVSAVAESVSYEGARGLLHIRRPPPRPADLSVGGRRARVRRALPAVSVARRACHAVDST